MQHLEVFLFFNLVHCSIHVIVTLQPFLNTPFPSSKPPPPPFCPSFLAMNPINEEESKIPSDNANAQSMASCQQGKEKDLKNKNKGTMRMGHSPLLRSPIIPLLLPPKIRLITNSYSSFVTVHSCLLFCAHNFHQYSVTLSCIIAFCLCPLYQSLPRILFIRINRLTIRTV